MVRVVWGVVMLIVEVMVLRRKEDTGLEVLLLFFRKRTSGLCRPVAHGRRKHDD